MYAMCTGHPPFRAESSYRILRKITDTEPRSIRELQPQIPEWLERFISRLLSKDPDDRLRTSAQVADLLKQCLAHLEQPAKLPLPAELLRKPRLSGRQIRIVGASILAITAICFGTWIVVSQQSTPTATETSTREANLPGWRDIDDVSEAIDQDLNRLEHDSVWSLESTPPEIEASRLQSTFNNC